MNTTQWLAECLVNKGDKILIDIDGGSVTQIDDGDPTRQTRSAPKHDREKILTRKRRPGASSPSDDLILKTDYIADQFGLSAAEFERYRNVGSIVVSVDGGSGEQADVSHLKCRFGNRVWEAVIDDKGSVVHEATTFLRGKLARQSKNK